MGEKTIFPSAKGLRSQKNSSLSRGPGAHSGQPMGVRIPISESASLGYSSVTKEVSEQLRLRSMAFEHLPSSKLQMLPMPGGSGGWSIILHSTERRFDSQSEYTQGATD